MWAFNRLHNGTMTGSTGLLSDSLVARPNAQGLGNRPVVKAKECQKPFEALATYLAKKPAGV